MLPLVLFLNGGVIEAIIITRDIRDTNCIMNMGLKLFSYNCRGLPKDNAKLCLRPDINELFNEADIIAFQETHFSKQNLKCLNSLHKSFVGTGAAKDDESEGIFQGRFSGGVCLMWRTELCQHIKQIDLNVSWCTAIEFSMTNTKFVIINVYLPYQTRENEDLYLEYLGYLKSFIDDVNCSNIVIVGDYNANLGLTGTKLFTNHLVQFCEENSLTISSKLLLPTDSYSYVSSREGVLHYSWLDHVVSSLDFHKCINNISIVYDRTDEDHIPVFINVNVESLPEVTNLSNAISGNINCEALNEKDLKKYLNLTDKLFSQINIPVEALCCSNLNCKDSHHTDSSKAFYENIIKSLSDSSTHLYAGSKSYKNRPGWSDYVSDIYKYSPETRRMWLENGKPRQGPYFREFSKSKAKFKYALRFISRNENVLRKESLAQKFSQSNSRDFWSEISSVNNCKMPLPSSIDNVNTPKEILQLWMNQFHNTFNCLPKQTYSEPFCLDSNYNNIKVSNFEIKDAIKSMDLNKSCGLDGIFAEHLKYASDKLIPLLSLCFSSLLVHGILPDSLMSVVLVPIIKNKCGNINVKENYRPIALASILSKVLELVILNRIEDFLITNDNQFGFKKGHGTPQCIYVLKEVIQLYRSMNTCISVCFMDASKAFDRVNHHLLFQKLKHRGVPGYIISLKVSNGV